MSRHTDDRPRRTGVRALCAVLAVLTVVGAAAFGAWAGWRSVVPMTVAVLGTLAVAGWRDRVPLVPVGVAVAVASALGTALGDPPVQRQSTGLATLVEIAATMLLLCLLARYAPARAAVVLCPVLGVLASTVLLRLQVPPTWLETAAQCVFFALGAIVAGAIGGYLRSLESRRLRSVREARRAQRLELARDLHDFVAHDVSGIVVLAQAAQVIGADRPEKVLPILQQIEAAGLQALGSMDRTVRMLDGSADRERAGEGKTQAYGLPEIADVVDRFRETGRAEVRAELDLTDEQIAGVPREVASTAHRIVVEALTNVRRHAAATPLVTVRVRCEEAAAAPVLTVSVTNEAPSLTPPGGGALGEGGRQGGGTGLAGLAERAEAIGGSLRYGPYGDGGWRVGARLPLD
ncbi:two-component sensor histidine kinase [Streptomyces sp. NBRC 14336]|uniref:sensor histidine kinase n=1 Tax=Streptomyces sp. NBRC 14336 TaxID=3030992 RepID=UPI0024A12F22|nr:histidine kinase [Streptomyces sp. NBRC 14336]WBO80854.1 histidine kinase [Streptomyces sp. SBE_14.2]GLW48112.1 two-component sensor histidine kinase [Streptomyces sp. NBRC 14336]